MSKEKTIQIGIKTENEDIRNLSDFLEEIYDEIICIAHDYNITIGRLSINDEEE